MAEKHTRKVLWLLLMLLVDTANPKSLHPPPSKHTIGADATNTERLHQSDIGRIRNDTAGTGISKSQRRKSISQDVKLKAVKILEDVAYYDDNVQSLDDVRDTIRASCGHDAVSAVDDVTTNLGEEQDVMTVMTIVALLQLHQCPSAATTITSRLLAAVDNTTDQDITATDYKAQDITAPQSANAQGLSVKASASQSRGLHNEQKENDMVESHGLRTHTLQPTYSENQKAEGSGPLPPVADYCDLLPECKQLGIPTVKRALVHHPSLLAIYDVAAAAVFSPGHTHTVANALVDDVMADLNVTVVELNVTGVSRVLRRSSCVDEDEAKAAEIISYIPIIGWIYSLISSAVYWMEKSSSIVLIYNPCK